MLHFKKKWVSIIRGTKPGENCVTKTYVLIMFVIYLPGLY